MSRMDSFLSWEEDYKSIESEFLNFVKYVPISKEHENVWSLKLANQLLLIGSSIDSFFKCALASFRRNIIQKHINSPKYGTITFKKENQIDKYDYDSIGYTIEDFIAESKFYENILNENEPNMGLYRDIFEDIYELSNKSIYVLRTEEKIRPFKGWENNKSPQWWIKYRALKHDKFQNRKLATLKTVLDSLAALFLLNVYHYENRKFLVDNNIIKSNIDLRSTDFFYSKKFHTIQPVIAKTELFGFIWDTDSLWDTYPWSILDPGNVYGL